MKTSLIYKECKTLTLTSIPHLCYSSPSYLIYQGLIVITSLRKDYHLMNLAYFTQKNLLV